MTDVCNVLHLTRHIPVYTQTTPPQVRKPQSGSIRQGSTHTMSRSMENILFGIIFTLVIVLGLVLYDARIKKCMQVFEYTYKQCQVITPTR